MPQQRKPLLGQGSVGSRLGSGEGGEGGGGCWRGGGGVGCGPGRAEGNASMGDTTEGHGGGGGGTGRSGGPQACTEGVVQTWRRAVAATILSSSPGVTAIARENRRRLEGSVCSLWTRTATDRLHWVTW